MLHSGLVSVPAMSGQGWWGAAHLWWTEGGHVAEGNEGMTWPSETFQCPVAENSSVLGVVQQVEITSWLQEKI